MADDFRGKTKAAVAGFSIFHHTSVSNPAQLDNTLGDVGCDDGCTGGYFRGHRYLGEDTVAWGKPVGV
jgi:hypothetical protein